VNVDSDRTIYLKDINKTLIWTYKNKYQEWNQW
jgi:hypothetical protein